MISRTLRQSRDEHSCPQVYFVVIFVLSVASLSYEINITRLFSVTQFYHFAFLIVSLALLGFGASGAFSAIFPKFGRKNLGVTLYAISFLLSASFLGSYLLTNYLPFDSYTFTLGWKQIGIFILHMVALTAPFFFSGLSIILLIRHHARQTNKIYAANLSGSAFGCLLALIVPSIISAVGLVVVCTLLSLLTSFLLIVWLVKNHQFFPIITTVLIGLSSTFLLILCLSDLCLRFLWDSSLELFRLNVSPYKGISYVMQYPGAEIIFQKWNSYSRVDLVRSKGIRSLPGYSYMATALPPEQAGLFIDGDDLSAVIEAEGVQSVTNFMPSSVAYLLRPKAKALILEPRGGLEIVIAHSEGAVSVESTEPNLLVVEAAQNIYDQDYVLNHLESGRSFLRKSREFYDVIILSLNSTFHPVRSGAYSLGEEYRYTVEAFKEAIQRLNPGGIFVVTRWLQIPPSEFLRSFAIAVEALDAIGENPAQDIAAFRSYNTGTLIIKRNALSLDEIETVRYFTADRAYDVVYYPGINSGEVNKYNILPEPYYYQTFTSLLLAEDRDVWYRDYPYEVKPPTDDKPFFNQFFKWRQIPQIINEFGRVWEPFGGAGYIILLFILILTIILALIFIIAPTIVFIRDKAFEPGMFVNLAFFAAIGLAYLFIEIPLIQTFTLFLDNPSYSLAAVLFALLFFSGIGSRYSNAVSVRKIFVMLLLLNFLNVFLLKHIINYALGFPLNLRILITIMLIAPSGFFMGMPFPTGIRSLENSGHELVSWAWGVNGAFSVVAGVAAAVLSISFGFRFVFIAGVILYFIAWMLLTAPGTRFQRQHP